MNTIGIGDILYDPISDYICEITRFGEDEFGQTAVEYMINKRGKCFYSSAWVIFKYFVKVGNI